MQIADVFKCPNKTVTRQSSSQRKSRRPSGKRRKLHCLNFVFPAENETLGPICLGCEASSSSVSLSMLKVPFVRTRQTWPSASYDAVVCSWAVSTLFYQNLTPLHLSSLWLLYNFLKDEINFTKQPTHKNRQIIFLRLMFVCYFIKNLFPKDPRQWSKTVVSNFF